MQSKPMLRVAVTAELPVQNVYKVSARNLTANWGDGDINQLLPISFTVSTGAILLVQGPSGIGKTTLAFAMAGLLPYSGSIQINSTEVRDIEQTSLTRNVLYGLQEAHLFSTSIRENLKIANGGASDEELLEALEIVEMAEFVKALPDGLDTHVGQFGYNFSGGERQRLTLARTLLSSAPIIILDEPTEHLDDEQANRIEVALISEFRDRLLVVISHRNWLHADQRIVLAAGE
jgi:ATP-binding cassette subfamily C protein CydC